MGIRKKMMAKEAGYSRSVNIEKKKSIKFAHCCPLSSKIVIRQLNVDCFVFVSKSKISTIFLPTSFCYQEETNTYIYLLLLYISPDFAHFWVSVNAKKKKRNITKNITSNNSSINEELLQI